MRRLGTFIELAAFPGCGAAASEVPESPRLIALQRELAAGNHRALDDFWREIQQQGAPLVERPNGDQRSVLVTFLWRAKDETKNVVVVGGLIPSWGVTNRTAREPPMAPLPDTDLCDNTYRSGPHPPCT